MEIFIMHGSAFMFVFSNPRGSEFPSKPDEPGEHGRTISHDITLKHYKNIVIGEVSLYSFA